MTTTIAPQTETISNVATALLAIKNCANLTEMQMVNVAEAILSDLPESALVWKQLHTRHYEEAGREITVMLCPKPLGLRWSDKFTISVEIETVQYGVDYDPSGAPVETEKSRDNETVEFTLDDFNEYEINGNEKNSAVIHFLTFLCFGKDPDEFYSGLDLYLAGRL